MIMTTAALCLAVNIFQEARGEPVLGQYAVAQVTMNRAGHDPKRVCKVVYQKAQFSWTLDKKKVAQNPAQVDPDAWRKSKAIARVVLAGKMNRDWSNGATYYHTHAVKPRWSVVGVKKSAVIGAHVFYRKLH